MRFLLPILLTASAMAYDFGVVKTMEPVSDDSEYFMEMPAGMAYSPAGGYYVVDIGARVVFHWNLDGSFAGTIGRPGAGPGEFGFMGMGGPQGYITLVNDTLYVYDGGRKVLQSFDLEGKFLGSKTLTMNAGRTNAFYITPDENYLIHHKSFASDPPKVEVMLTNDKGEETKKIVSMEDTTFRREGSDRANMKIVIMGYSEDVISNYNVATGELMVGHSGKPEFDIYDSNGKLIKNVRIDMPRLEVTATAREEYDQMPWIKNSNFFKTDFPEMMPYYNNILPIGKSGFLVYNLSPHYRNVVGFKIDRNGKVLDRFEMACGENGLLAGAAGKIVSIRTDDWGDFIIQELTTNPGAGNSAPGQ